MIKQCKCKSEQQDKLYGDGKRVFNPTEKAHPLNGRPAVRCTVCNTEKPA